MVRCHGVQVTTPKAKQEMRNQATDKDSVRRLLNEK